MDQIARSWYDMAFENNFLKKRGNEFQNWFSDIMERRYPADFIRTRPWGNIGDRKNDGYLKTKRMLFQIYAPNEMTAAEAIKKIDEDFNEALPYWQQYFDIWVFVHNAYDGLGPHIVSKLLELEQLHTPLRITHWGFPELLGEMRLLTYADLISLFGYAPSNESMRQIGFEDLKVAVDFIAEQPPILEPDLRPPPPNKLEKNALSPHVETLLKAGMRKSDRVRKFFAQYHDPLYGDRIAEAFKKEYQVLKKKGKTPDQIFMGLLAFAGGANRGTARHEASVLAVLAYLFEECDIFEP